MVADVEDLANEVHNQHVVRALHELWICKYFLLDDWEKHIYQVLKWFAVLVDFKLKRLNDGLKGAQTRYDVAFVAWGDSVADCFEQRLIAPTLDEV